MSKTKLELALDACRDMIRADLRYQDNFHQFHSKWIRLVKALDDQELAEYASKVDDIRAHEIAELMAERAAR